MKSKTAVVMLLGYAALVAYMSLSPAGSANIGGYDKIAHLLTYTLFALLASRLHLSACKYVVLCTIIIGYGGAMEIGQSYVPGRDMSALDMLANMLGVLVGAALYLFGLQRPYDTPKK